MTELFQRFKEFTRQRGLKKYGANTFWLFLERGVRMVLGVLVGVWLARHLGPRDFGVLSFAESVAAVCGALSLGCLDELLVREILEHPKRKNSIMGTAFALKIAGAVLSILTAALFAWAGDHPPRHRTYHSALFLLLSLSGRDRYRLPLPQ